MSNTVVRTNVMALNSHRNLGLTGNQQARASQRLSSGFRINSAADDAAGLAISEGMRAQIRGMAQASRNAQDGISMIQTAEGYMQTVTELLQRARELAVQGANDTYNPEQRTHIANEMNQIASELNRIWVSATFNGQQMFANSQVMFGADSFHLQVGADGGGMLNGAASQMVIDVIYEVGSTTINAVANWINHSTQTVMSTWGFTANIMASVAAGRAASVLTHTLFNNAISIINGQLDDVAAFRAALGAIQNRLEFTIQNLDIARENLSAAESRVRDADMASEMMRLTQANVLQQAATSMLAQANQAPQSVLQLLG